MKINTSKLQLVKGLLCLFIISLCTQSCVSRKNIAYMQGEGQLKIDMVHNNLKIKPDDLLTIRVSTADQEAALPFNLTKTVGQPGAAGNIELETYMVSNNGTIEFPIVGTIAVTGLTDEELSKKIKSLISDYVKDAIVNVRILNFQISVLGEVKNPGTYTVKDDHITLPKALGLAGDLTMYGKRKKILLVRQEDGIQTRHYIDITNPNIVQSPYYNLQQNDVIYVEPVGSRRQSASSLSTAGSYLSLASVLISMVVLLVK